LERFAGANQAFQAQPLPALSRTPTQSHGSHRQSDDLRSPCLPTHQATHLLHLSDGARIIRCVSESYQAKRERWQRLLETLPPELREHVSLRNVEAVAALTPQAQQRLAEAMRSGLKRLPRAVEQLRADPDTPLSQLLQPAARESSGAAPAPQSAVGEVTGLIQSCFPDMPRLSAEALSSAEVMEIVVETAQAHGKLLNATQLHTEFVMVVLYALMRRTVEQLNAIIAASPSLERAVLRSALPVESLPWSQQDAQKNR
jgi:hypothetical protein